MPKIIVVPTAEYLGVLVTCDHPALTHDAAWGYGAHRLADAKQFADETAARTYLARYLPDLPAGAVVICDAEERHPAAIAGAL